MRGGLPVDPILENASSSPALDSGILLRHLVIREAPDPAWSGASGSPFEGADPTIRDRGMDVDPASAGSEQPPSTWRRP